MPVRLSRVKTTRRKTHETYDYRTCYSLRTLKHLRTRANHRCSHDWHSHDWNERTHNRLVSEQHWVCYGRFDRPKQGQERFRKHPHAQPFAKRININSDGSRLWAPQVERRPRSFAGLFLCTLRGVKDRNMKPDSWGILAFVGCFILLVLFIKDWETKTGADKLSRMKLPHQSALSADPDLKLVSEHSP
ncbi:MAG: hypothetical protein QOJ15_2553 [Bradyrhizobium sp.]|nr:hypothetical protein [Bradyrhizobium sp.]